MAWWLWIVVGIILLVGEVTLPSGLFLLFFGFSGILTGILTLVGIVGPESVQWMVFTILAIAMLLLFRSRLKRIFGGHAAHKDIDNIAGQVARTIDAIGINASGQVELRGTNWSAKNIGNKPLSAGQYCTVSHVDGLTLLVKGE